MAGVLCILAHPDDEIFCAGLLARLTEEGIPLHLVCMTRGEGGSLGHPPKVPRSKLGRIREQEMRCSAEVLGANSLTFLDYVDPLPTEDLRVPEYDPEQLTEEIEGLIEQYDPQLVLTHGSNGDYGHPAHALLHEKIKSTTAGTAGDAPSMFSFNAFHPSIPRSGALNDDDWADVVVDVSRFFEAKSQTLKCHSTQWDVFVGEKSSAEEYESSIAEYVESIPKEGYCCHSRNSERRHQHILAVWLDREPDSPPTRYAQALWDALRQRQHQVWIDLKRRTRPFRRSLRSSWSEL